jgi:hypothetical protein
MKVICTTTLLLAIAAATALAKDPPEKPATTRPAAPTYTAPDKSFTIEYPAGWKVREKPNKLALVGFVNPANPADLITIIVAPDAGKVTLQDWANAARDGLKEGDPKFKALDDAAHDAGDNKCWRFIYDTPFNGRPCRMIEYLVLANGTGYVIDGISSIQRHQQMLPIVEKSVASFRPAKTAEKDK